MGNSPSLQRGLRVLQILGERGVVGYGEISRELGTANASTSRVLGPMMEMGFVVKVEGGYALGPEVQSLVGGLDPWEEFLRGCEGVMEALSRECRLTVLLVVREEGVLIHRLKVLHEEGAVMREVGSRKVKMTDHPWGWCFLEDMKEEEVKGVMAREGRAWPEEDVRGVLREKGGLVWEGDRSGRMACGVKDGRGRVVASLALGGHLPRKEREGVGKRLLAAADELQKIYDRAFSIQELG